MRLLCTLALLTACASPPADAPADPDDRANPTERAILGLALTPSRPMMQVSEDLTFSVRAYYEDASWSAVGDGLSWEVDGERVVELTGPGQLRALRPGVATVTAQLDGGRTARTEVTVRGEGDLPDSLRLRPGTIRVTQGSGVDVAALGTYADGVEGNLSAYCAWGVSDPEVASVEAGWVDALAPGEATLSAYCGPLEAHADLRVDAPGAAVAGCALRVGEVLVEGGASGVVLLAEVVNEGDGGCGGFYVDGLLTKGGTPTASDAVSTDWVPGLGPGEDALVLIEASGVSAGTYSAWVWADPDGWQGAPAAGALAGPVQVEVGAGPRLVLTSAIGITDGEVTLYEVVIENQGASAARRFWIDLWRDPAAQPHPCAPGDEMRFVDVLDAGASLTWDLLVEQAPGPSGWLSLAWVDGCGATGAYDADAQEALVVVE